MSSKTPPSPIAIAHTSFKPLLFAPSLFPFPQAFPHSPSLPPSLTMLLPQIPPLLAPASPHTPSSTRHQSPPSFHPCLLVVRSPPPRPRSGDHAGSSHLGRFEGQKALQFLDRNLASVRFPRPDPCNGAAELRSSRATSVRPRSDARTDWNGLSPGSEAQALTAEVATGRFVPPRAAQTEEYFIAGYGWRVRSVCYEDMDSLKQVATIQAEVFHAPSGIFNDFFFTIFKAEVLSSLLYKTRHSSLNRYACLVAEADASQVTSGKIVGVVDVVAMAENDVLRHLSGAEDYLYVSGMAVDAKFRRQKVATVLLQACDLTALQWGFGYLVLQAYEDDIGARSLYSRAGYRVISKDPPWFSTWMGRRRRVVLAKRTPHESALPQAQLGE